VSAYVLTDSWTMTRRELAHWARQPVQVVVSLVFPVMLLLMFGYLIGGGRAVAGPYVDYLVPGMLALTMAFGLEGTMLAVTQDLNKGVIDRFRSMPMADGAVLVGRSAADMLQSAIGLVVLIGVGLALGWRPQGGGGGFFGRCGAAVAFPVCHVVGRHSVGAGGWAARDGAGRADPGLAGRVSVQRACHACCYAWVAGHGRSVESDVPDGYGCTRSPWWSRWGIGARLGGGCLAARVVGRVFPVRRTAVPGAWAVRRLAFGVGRCRAGGCPSSERRGVGLARIWGC